MKNTIVISFLLTIVIFVSGCTYIADQKSEQIAPIEIEQQTETSQASQRNIEKEPQMDLTLNSVKCNLARKEVRDDGDIIDYYFEIVASGSANGPVGAQLRVDISDVTRIKSSPQYFTSLWTITERTPSDTPHLRREAGDQEKNEWTAQWTDILVEDAHGYASRYDSFIVNLHLTSPPYLEKNIDSETIKCNRS